MRMAISYAAVTLAFLLSASNASAQDTASQPVVRALSLADALSMAVEHNPSLKQADAQWDASIATLGNARAQSAPTISTTTYAAAGDSANNLSSAPGVAPQNILTTPTSGFVDQNITLMVPVFTRGRLGDAIGSARNLSESARLDANAQRISVTEAVTEAYADAAVQQSLVGVAQARLDAENEEVRETTAMVADGRLAAVDLLREQAEQADAAGSLLAAENQEALDLVNIRALLGISQLAPIRLSDTLEGLVSQVSPVPPLPLAISQADSYRPEIMAAQCRLEAAKKMVSAAGSEYSPQVYGLAMGDLSQLRNGERTGYTIGLAASLPLMDGGTRKSDRDSAQAGLLRAQADLLAARRTVEQQTAAACLSVSTAQAQIVTADAGVDAAKEAYRLANMRHDAGKSTTADRLDALAALTKAQADAAQAKGALIVSRAQLAAALGLCDNSRYNRG